MVSTTCTHAYSLCGIRLLHPQQFFSSSAEPTVARPLRLHVSLSFSYKQSEGDFV
ncbi:hypothetical protein D3C72_68390 [compost metagenome]